jgi:hypothetical protein
MLCRSMSVERRSELTRLYLLRGTLVAVPRATSGAWSAGRGTVLHMDILRRIASSPSPTRSGDSRRWSRSNDLSLRSRLTLDGKTLRIRPCYANCTAFRSLLCRSHLHDPGWCLSAILAIAVAKCRGRAVPDDLECRRTTRRVQIFRGTRRAHEALR